MYRLKLELDGYAVDVAGDGITALEKARTLRPDIVFLDLRLPKLDGLAALEKARTTSPDIIFLDIRLPKLDGLGVLEALRGDPSTAKIPVVILSNWNERELVERGVSLGALDHLIKSQTTPARLSQRLKDWLKS